jgi:two-component system cell cycle response regulator DivK
MGHKRILVVEDNEDHRRILIHRLRQIGQFEIVEAQQGQEALDLVTVGPLDLIVLDMRLPVIDGWEVTRRIRVLPLPICAVPILACTGYALPGDEERIRAVGCNDYIAKPLVGLQALKEKVKYLLAERGSAGDERQPTEKQPQSNKDVKDESLRPPGKELKDSDRGVLYASYDFLASDLCADLSHRAAPSAKLIHSLSAPRPVSFKR